MNALIRPILLATACAMAFPSLAADRCEQTRSESPNLDLSGVRRVVASIGADELALSPSQAGQSSLAIRHCASDADRLAKSQVKVERVGDELRIESRDSSITIYGLFGKDIYTWREISLSLPADLPVSLNVGSGDAAVRGMSDLTVDVGSGDVNLRQVGRVIADVGSGDLGIDGATSVSVDVGSGDAALARVQGEVSANVGSGDIVLNDVGPIAALSAGSGSIGAERVRGDARINSVGSGDIGLKGVSGFVRVGEVGSGDVDLRDIEGDVMVSDKDTLKNVNTDGIRGRIIVGS